MSTLSQARSCYRCLTTCRNFTRGNLSFQRAFLNYKDGYPALLTIAITTLALAALATYAGLLLSGTTLSPAIPLTSSLILLTSTILFGPKVYSHHIPALLSFIADLSRCRIHLFTHD